MILHKEWFNDNSSNKYGINFKTKEETINEVKERFDIQRFMSAEGETYSVRPNIFDEETWYDETGVINNHSNPYNEDLDDMRIFTPCESLVSRGCYIYWHDTYWVVMSKPKTNYAYNYAKIIECNNYLNFVTKYGEIKKYPVYFNDKAQRTDFFYSPNGTIQNGRVELDVPYDKYTTTIEMNDKFMFDGVVYKVTYVSKHNPNTLEFKNGVVTLMFTIDEKSNAHDDIENNITNVNKVNRFNLVCDIDNIVGNVGNKGKIVAKITDNNVDCNEEISYEIENKNIISIDENGNYELLKNGECQIKVYMKNNPDKVKIICVTVNDIHVVDDIKIEIIPNETFIYEEESKTYTCKKYVNNVEVGDNLTITDISTMKDGYYEIDIVGNTFTIHNLKKHSSKKVEIDVTDGTITEHVSIQLKGVL